jgi:hypothetical protein
VLGRRSAIAVLGLSLLGEEEQRPKEASCHLTHHPVAKEEQPDNKSLLVEQLSRGGFKVMKGSQDERVSR